MSLLTLTPVQLRRAANLKEKIAALNKELATLIGGSATPAPLKAGKPVVAKKGGMSAAGKARIAAAQKRRWAKVRAAKAVKSAKTVEAAAKK